MILTVSVILTVWSAVTLWLIGGHTHARLGFATGVGCQVLWIVFDLMVGAYGLLPLALVYGPLYVRGYMKWRAVEPASDYDAGFHDGMNDGWQRAMEAEHPPEDEYDEEDVEVSGDVREAPLHEH